ncbi:MAG: amidohydrolase [Parvularculaceae bacterium]
MTSFATKAAAAALALSLAACGRTGADAPGDAADAASATGEAPRPGAYFIFGGPIYPDAKSAAVEAVLVEDGRIAGFGARADLAEAARGAAMVDLQGGALFPGFVDGHVHLIGVGLRELTLNLEGVASVAALVDAVAGAVAETPDGAAVTGRGWIETGWPEERFPTRADIDPASPDNPVILYRADGHALLANSAALERASVDAGTQSPDGGRIETDADGAPTGLLVDAAMSLVAGLVERPDAARRAEAYAVASDVYASRGWTGVHNMSVAPDDLSLIEDAAAAGDVAIRVYNAIDPAGLDDLIETGPRAAANGRVVTRAVKMYVDGALGSRGAALEAPYADAPEQRGLLLIDEAAAKAAYEKALRGGVQIATHAIGDRGNRLVLDWYEDVFAATPVSERAVADPRWRIEHAQIVRPADFPRFAELGVMASMQPSHAIGDLFFAPARLGSDRLDGAYAWRSLLDADAVIVGGSDAPVERGDPLIEFYAAVARRSLDGFSTDDWRPDEAVTRAEALAMFTSAPAFAAFEEAALGDIAVGKRADLSGFSVDLMTAPLDAIPQGAAVFTMVDGAVVHGEDLVAGAP